MEEYSDKNYPDNYPSEEYPHGEYPEQMAAGETPVNDAANFKRKQAELASTPPASVMLAQAPVAQGSPRENDRDAPDPPRKRKQQNNNNKQGRKAKKRGRQQMGLKSGLNPLSPSLKVAVMPMRKPNRRRKKGGQNGQKGQNPDMQGVGNMTSANNTSSGITDFYYS